MPLLFFILIGLLLPRVTIALLWLFSNWFTGSGSGIVIPLLGFLFLPYTLLWYSAVMRLYDGRWGLWQILFLVLAIIFDLSSVRQSLPVQKQ